MRITLVIKALKTYLQYEKQQYIHFYNKNIKYRYVTIKIHLTISNLKKVCLKDRSLLFKYGISRSSRGRAFHNLGADTWNDLSPSVALVLNAGDASKIPPGDLRLYAPCDLKSLCNIKFPYPVREIPHTLRI